MRIIKEGFLVQAAREFPKAASYLETWRKVVRAAAWRNLVELRRTYPGTDLVEVETGRRVLVFNVRKGRPGFAVRVFCTPEQFPPA